jgi:hypothetical protein
MIDTASITDSLNQASAGFKNMLIAQLVLSFLVVIAIILIVTKK